MLQKSPEILNWPSVYQQNVLKLDRRFSHSVLCDRKNFLTKNPTVDQDFAFNQEHFCEIVSEINVDDFKRF